MEYGVTRRGESHVVTAYPSDRQAHGATIDSAEVDYELTKLAHVTLQHEGLDSLAEKLTPYTKADLASGEVRTSFDLRTVCVPVGLLRETSQALAQKGYWSWAASMARAAAPYASI